MNVDRGHELILSPEGLQEKPLDSIDIHLDDDDIEALSKPSVAYTMDRLMGCTAQGTIYGWAPEDKIHIRLENAWAAERYQEKAVTLSLDPGGDLYFTVWDSLALYRASDHEVFSVDEEFVTSDPRNKLGEVGITAVRFHDLKKLADRICGIL